MTITQKIIEIHHGKTARQIADALGCRHATVWTIANRYRLRLKKESRMHAAKITKDAAESIRHDYRPLSCIAKEHGISTAQACRIRAGMHFNDKPMSASQASGL